ncbi:hypothetical protein BDW59DRAFT_109738 [Aspergillus cavernicola]|uniref:Carrier domain-containing protein n=1 Tax=Aspergillus cavernicola TaxID=176166 RepID=A0ABR4I0Z9_9EURO
MVMSIAQGSGEPRLLPSILDHRAASQPDRVWAKFPTSPTSYAQGFRSATYRQIYNAVNSIAWKLAKTIGTSTAFDTLAYLGPGDLRYHIVLLAAIKTRYKAFLPSPRNSVIAQKDLLSRLDCRVLVTTDPEPPFVSGLLREYPVRVVRIPSLDKLLESQDGPAYPYDKTFEEARNDPVLVLHTSGSTGFPKPMIYTNEFVLRIYKANSLPALEGTQRIDDLFLQGEFFSFLPAFHIAGIGWGLVLPMFSNSVPILPLPGRPPSTDAFIDAVKYGSFDWAFLLPVIIDEISKDAASLDLITSKLQYLFYTGGALPQTAGKLVSSRIPIYSGLGSSEFSALPQLKLAVSSPTDTWQYVYIHPAVGPQFRHHLDDLHELVIVKSPGNTDAQPVFAMFPDLEEYETRDLFSPHPSIPHLWRHQGRRDDIIVFLNGEKTNPISFEQHVSQHPAVGAALVAGSQRFEACLIIEPATSEELSGQMKAELIEEVWPAVEEANTFSPAHARISKSKILVLDVDRPMLRAGKGTVQRAGTVELYKCQIDALYSDTPVQSPGETSTALVSTLTEVLDALRTLVHGTTSWTDFSDDDDFFTLGMDSLQVLQNITAIRSTFNISITPSIIYRNPTLALLAKHIYPGETAANAGYDRIAAMTDLLKGYEHEIDKLAFAKLQPNERANSSSQVVILTGSTGAVGSFVLEQLLLDPDISHVYCLNRAVDSGSLQAARNQQRDLVYEIPSENVTYLTVDLTKNHFNLDATVYNTLLNKTTRVIHNAWPVNFNLSLRSFQPSLDGLLNLISFTTQAKLAPSLLFLSSISAITSYHTLSETSGPVPEEVITNPACTAAMGYGESKYLGERILNYASTKFPSSAFGICRIGQIAGTAKDPRGWNRSEWLPSLIISSRYLKALPDSLGGSQFDIIDWVPIDELAPIVVELSASLVGTSSVQIFHCTNPRPISWASLLPVIAEEIGQPGSTTRDPSTAVTVPLTTWLQKLRDSIALELKAEQNPAAKLADFYEQLLDIGSTLTLILPSEKTKEASKSLAKLRPIQPEWLRGWITEWLD